MIGRLRGQLVSRQPPFLLLDVNAYPPVELEAMANPVACIFRLERSPTLGTAAIEDLDDLLAAAEHAGLRRTIALWLTQTLLPSRLPGVTVPETEQAVRRSERHLVIY